MGNMQCKEILADTVPWDFEKQRAYREFPIQIRMFQNVGKVKEALSKNFFKPGIQEAEMKVIYFVPTNTSPIELLKFVLIY